MIHARLVPHFLRFANQLLLSINLQVSGYIWPPSQIPDFALGAVAADLARGGPGRSRLPGPAVNQVVFLNEFCRQALVLPSWQIAACSLLRFAASLYLLLVLERRLADSKQFLFLNIFFPNSDKLGVLHG